MGTATDPFVSDLTFDDSAAISAASAAIRAYCRWHIWPNVDDSRTFDVGARRQFLALPSLLVTAVASVEEINPRTGDTDTLAYRDDYSWSPSGMLMRHGRYWRPGLQTVQVSFSHGFTDVPGSIAAVTIALAKRLPASMTATQQEAAGSVSRSFATAAASALTDLEKIELDQYRAGR